MWIWSQEGQPDVKFALGDLVTGPEKQISWERRQREIQRNLIPKEVDGLSPASHFPSIHTIRNGKRDFIPYEASYGMKSDERLGNARGAIGDCVLFRTQLIHKQNKQKNIYLRNVASDELISIPKKPISFRKKQDFVQNRI